MISRFFLVVCIVFQWGNQHIVAQTGTIKSPDEFLPHALGSRFTPHHLIVDYFRYVDGLSNRIQLHEYGRTNELRPLMAAIVGLPHNLNRLEDIRLNNLRRTGLIPGDVKEDDIAIVYLSYSIHGDEAAGSECSMAVLYDLVKGNPEIDQWLEHAIVIIDPCLNPDGFDRFVQWSNSVSHYPSDPRPESREHHQPWPGGRSNHYYFDLNRDWVWQTQKESRARIAFYQQWMPHIHADLHEMDAESPYYFAPAAQPYHPHVSQWQGTFQQEIGKNHALHFDKLGWRYFTKEKFDLFYPSYGDTYPTFAGAIGMTYEQGGSGYCNRAVILEHGDTLTLADRIAHHRVTSLSTIEVSSNNASRLVKEFESYFKKSIAEPHALTYVVKKSNNPGRVNDLIALLDKQAIRYGVIANEKKGLKGFSYTTGHLHDFSADAGDLVVPASQPRSLLLQVLFEPEGELTDSLTYDITAWSVPLAYGLDIFSTSESLDYIPLVIKDKTTTADPGLPYAYALPWGSVPAAQILTSLQNSGIIARYAGGPFSIGGIKYPAGTVLCLRADNRKLVRFDAIIQDVEKTSGLTLSRIQTGLAESGKDLGSDHYKLVRKPEVLAFTGKGISSLNLGELWHFFEEELKYPIHLIDLEDASHTDLSAYNVIVLTEGYYSIDDSLLETIRNWVTTGGRLIVIGSGIKKVAGKSGFRIQSIPSTGTRDSINQEQMTHPNTYASAERKFLTDQSYGFIIQTSLNKTHPLTFGLGETYWTLKTNASSYAWMPDGHNAIYLDDTLHYYGFVGYQAKEKLKKTLLAGQEDKGSGSIIYLVDNPLFRGFWNSGKVLFSNALFF